MPTHPLHLTHLKTGKEFFEVPWGQLAYERVGEVHVVAGPPIGGIQVLEAFIAWSHSRGRGICGYYFPESTPVPLGFKRYQIGVSRSLDLTTFGGCGKKWRDFRRALNQGYRSQLTFNELLKPEMFLGEVEALEGLWREERLGLGRIAFLLSSATSIVKEERFFEVREKGCLSAFVSILPYWEGEEKSYYIDTLIQSPRGHRFALDFLLSRLILLLKEEDVQYLNFGLCVFQKVTINSFLEGMIDLQGRLNLLYNSRGLYQYKRKFTDIEEREYLLMDSCRSFMEQVLALYRVTWPPRVGSTRHFNCATHNNLP